MGATTIKSRLAAIDLSTPRVAPVAIEAGLCEHLARLGAGRAKIELASDLEAGFRKAARIDSRSWQARFPGPRWPYKNQYWIARFALWEERPYFQTGRYFAAADLDREVARAARRSATHWRNPQQTAVLASWLAKPILASRVALRAAWDESDAAKMTPELPAPGEWRHDFTLKQKHAYWQRYDAWHRSVNSPERGAAARADFAEPLVAAVEAGLFAFFWLARDGTRKRRSHTCIAVPRPRLLTEQVARGTLTTTALHCWDEPAVSWLGGPAYWYWQGVRIWREVIERPSRLTARYIVAQSNVERRRVLLERMGYEAFLASADATRVQQDDYGQLWKTDLRLDGERVSVVEVTNSTREPDGSYRRYFLRVPPSVRTAREAVAWTFGYERAREYEIAVQS